MQSMQPEMKREEKVAAASKCPAKDGLVEFKTSKILGASQHSTCTYQKNAKAVAKATSSEAVVFSRLFLKSASPRLSCEAGSIVVSDSDGEPGSPLEFILPPIDQAACNMVAGMVAHVKKLSEKILKAKNIVGKIKDKLAKNDKEKRRRLLRRWESRLEHLEHKHEFLCENILEEGIAQDQQLLLQFS